VGNLRCLVDSNGLPIEKRSATLAGSKPGPLSQMVNPSLPTCSIRHCSSAPELASASRAIVHQLLCHPGRQASLLGLRPWSSVHQWCGTAPNLPERPHQNLPPFACLEASFQSFKNDQILRIALHRHIFFFRRSAISCLLSAVWL